MRCSPALALVLWLGVALWLAGCQSPALIRTARTLPAGATDLSVSLNLSRASIGETRAGGIAIPVRDFNLPNPIPEVMLDHGLADGVQLGVRVSLGSGLVEGHAVLRLIEAADSTLRVAIAPAVGYRALGLVNGPVFSLPVPITYDLAPSMSLNVGPLVSVAAYSVPDSLRFGDALDISGDTLYVGGGLGLELRPALGIHVMPAIEVQRSVLRRGDLERLPQVDMLFFAVTLGWASSG